MSPHFPVLLDEVLSFFSPKKSDLIVDCTLGNAGHTSKFLETGAKVIALDRNQKSIEVSKQKLSDKNIEVHQDNFANLAKYLSPDVTGILADLGLSTPQIKDDNLGLSFHDTALDMRLDNSQVTAKEIINTYDYQEIVDILSYYSQEDQAGSIAKKILYRRQKTAIKSALELSALVQEVYKEKRIISKTHPATKTFMALRIYINQEYNNLKKFLEQTKNTPTSCKIAVITFHSGEDRLVKTFLQKNINIFLVNKPIFPNKEELRVNPSSRSAILRTFIKKA